MQAFCLICSSFSSSSSQLWPNKNTSRNKSPTSLPPSVSLPPARHHSPLALSKTVPSTTPKENSNNKRPYRPYKPRRRPPSHPNSNSSADASWNPARPIRHLAQQGDWEKLLSRVDQISADERTVAYAASLAYKAGKRGVADSLFRRMRARGVIPGPYSYSVMLKGLTRSRASSPSVVDSLVRDLESDKVALDSVLLNSIADAFVRTGALRNACDFVRRNEHSELRNTRTFNILMRGFVSAQKIDAAFEIQQEMIDDGHQPTDVTINTLINGCARAGDYQRAWELARQLPKYLPQPDAESNNENQNAATDSAEEEEHDNNSDNTSSSLSPSYRRKSKYNKNRITDSTRKRNNAIQVAMTAVMTSYVNDRRYEEARQLLKEISESIDPPSGITYASFVKACLQNGAIEYARLIVAEMPENTESKIFAYNALVAGLCRMQAGRTDIAMQVVLDMQREGSAVKPVAETYNELLEGLRRRKDYTQVEKVMEMMEDNDFAPPDVVSYTVLMRGFGARDDPDGARRVFAKMMRKKIRPDEVALNTLIAANCRGTTKQDLDFALRIIRELESSDASWRPTAATYSPVIAHYARSRDFDQSWATYERMKKNGVKPNVFVVRMMYNSLIIFGPGIVDHGTPEKRTLLARKCAAVLADACNCGIQLEQVRKWRRKSLAMFGNKKQLEEEISNAQLRFNIISSSERIFQQHGWNDIDSSWKFM